MLTVVYSLSIPGPDSSEFTVSAAVTATGALSAKIFVYRSAGGAFDFTEGTVGDAFSCVASLAQMETVPADAPAEGFPHYRVALATFVCKHESDVSALRAMLDEDIQQLVADFKASIDLQETETVNYV